MENEFIKEQDTKEKGIETDLMACQLEVSNLKDKLMRLNADFDNMRKNTEKEIARSRIMGQTPLLLDILSIVDDFDRAFEKLPHAPEKDIYYAGFELIYKAFHKLLTKYGVEEISETKNFDPELHEAIMQVSDENKESGSILQVLQKGYRYKGNVLRPAKVSVIS